jgi:hypothetical protein
MQVTLVVAEGSGSLERLTHGGGFEKLKGSLSETSMSLAGEGRNGPDDFWRTAFTGKFSGTTFVAEGGLVSDFGAAVRSCSLNLSHGAPVSPNTSQLIDPASIAGSYAGSGEGGQVTMVIEPKGQDGKFPVQLSTKVTEGGCGGGASGWATYAGTQLSIVAEADGNRCHVQGTVGAKGIELEEGDGCLRFHGAACGFSASLIRSK